MTIEFAAVVTSSLDGSIAEKAQLVDIALRELGIDAGDAVMVGDREFDIIGAKANNVASIGVLWGYGSRAELEAVGADAIAEDVEAFRALLL